MRTRGIFLSLVTTALVLLVATKLAAAGFAFECSVFQGFNFQKDRQNNVGFIESLKIDGIELKPDLTVVNPVALEKQIKIAAVISDLEWNGESFDPVLINANISTENKNSLVSILKKAQPKPEIEASFSIYSYDPQSKKYFKSFYTDAKKLSCTLLNNSGELALTVENTPSAEIKSPAIHRFSIGFLPQRKNMQIHIAINEQARMVKPFGNKSAR